MDSRLNIEIPPRYRTFCLLEDEGSSDTDTGNIRLCWTFFIFFFKFILSIVLTLSDVMAESTAMAANRWRQSSSIR
jgi:hypothetical protein